MQSARSAPSKPRRTFDLVEVVGCAAIAALITAIAIASRVPLGVLQNPQAVVAGWDGALEVKNLQRRFGSTRASAFAEEWIIRDFFDDKRGGVFLDVGANHYHDQSNTYYLETALGWSGIAIEPQGRFAADYARYRPRTRFVQMFASDSAGSTPFFTPPDNSLMASSDRAFASLAGSTSESTIPTSTLDAILQSAGITHLDFVSMDIELAEPKALAGFDISRYLPAFVCIEAHPEVRQQILDYFHAHDYVVVGKYLQTDWVNLYFTPAARSAGSSDWVADLR